MSRPSPGVSRSFQDHSHFVSLLCETRKWFQICLHSDLSTLCAKSSEVCHNNWYFWLNYPEWEIMFTVLNVAQISFPLIFNLFPVSSPPSSCFPPQGSRATLWCVWCDGNLFHMLTDGGEEDDGGLLVLWWLSSLKPAPLPVMALHGVTCAPQQLSKPPAWYIRNWVAPAGNQNNQYGLGENQNDEIVSLSFSVFVV